MEPKQSMTRYAGVVFAALALRAFTGAADAAAYGAAALLLAGLVLDSGYRISVGGVTRRILKHRLELDQLVRKLWVGTGLASLVVAGLVAAADLELWDPPRPIDPLLTAAPVAALGVLISSLIDWYWILPRVGGIKRKAPCEEAGGQKWARVTGVWLFHRGVATLMVAGSLVGVALYMEQVETGDDKTLWLVIFGTLSAGTIAFSGAALRALWLAFNPKLHVGDILEIHGRRAYVVDVSLQGAKYRWLSDDPPPEDPPSFDVADPGPTAEFTRKKDDSFSLEDFGRFHAAEDQRPPCADRCKAINWYCRHNPHVYE